MKKPFYITTTLPYVNADPHIGFAMELVRADIIARYNKLVDHEVFFNYGTDEHGLKVWKRANELEIPVEKYVETCAEKYKNLKGLLNLLSEVNFIRTTDPHHIIAAQEFWRVCNKNGYIYKKNYKIKYCVGCELEKTESELVDGKCPIHPGTPIEIIEEENYFFKFSEFQKPLLDLYEENPKFVIPDFRFNEIKAFVLRGLEDFSISRLKSKMPWGVPVPGDSEHVMYVWFDALVNYVSVVGWPDKKDDFKKWWIDTGGVVQYCGKDNLRQQSAMWQAMLMAAGLSPSKTIVIDGFITSGGQKMSKSLGNVINPFDVVKEYGTDALRYFIARELSPFEDSDFTMENFREAYNANLANGLGNLVSRVMKMAADNLSLPVIIPENAIPENFKDALNNFDIKSATDIVWTSISSIDSRIQETQPFKLVKTDKKKAEKIIREVVIDLYTIARMLNPILPETMEKIKALVKSNKAPTAPLFPRKD